MAPRRNIKSSQYPAEYKTVEIIQEIESIGADVLLTEAVMLLSQAKDKISDYYDKNCDFCTDIPEGSFYLGTTCGNCLKPFRSVK